jgi:hypothetical protein
VARSGSSVGRATPVPTTTQTSTRRAAGPHAINLGGGLTYQLDQCGEPSSGALIITVGPLTINGNGSTIETTCTDDGPGRRHLGR